MALNIIIKNFNNDLDKVTTFCLENNCYLGDLLCDHLIESNNIDLIKKVIISGGVNLRNLFRKFCLDLNTEIVKIIFENDKLGTYFLNYKETGERYSYMDENIFGFSGLELVCIKHDVNEKSINFLKLLCSNKKIKLNSSILRYIKYKKEFIKILLKEDRFNIKIPSCEKLKIITYENLSDPELLYLLVTKLEIKNIFYLINNQIRPYRREELINNVINIKRKILKL